MSRTREQNRTESVSYLWLRIDHSHLFRCSLSLSVTVSLSVHGCVAVSHYRLQGKRVVSERSKEATEALDNNLFNESRSDSRYVKYDPQRDSNVTFGRK